MMEALDRLRALPPPLRPLYFGTLATRLGAFVVPYLTIYLSQGRGFSLATTGTIIAAGGAGLLIGNLLGGQLADRLGRKDTLLLALFVNGVGLAVLSQPLLSAVAHALVLGLALAGAGMYTPAANALIADLTTDRERPFAYTVNYLCINVGMGLGPLLGGLVAASSYGWLFAGDLATSALCGALIAAGIPRRRPPRPRQRERGVATWRVWGRHPSLTLFAGASVFVVAPLMGLEYAVPLFVHSTFSEALVFVGLVYSINAACILVLSLPIERAIAGRNEAAMMALAAALWVAGMAILAVGFSLGALLVCTVVWTAGEIVGSIVLPTFIARRVAASVKGRMLSLQDAVRSVAAIGCPIALGAVWDHGGESMVVLVLVALPLVGAGVYALWWKRGAGKSLASVGARAGSR